MCNPNRTQLQYSPRWHLILLCFFGSRQSFSIHEALEQNHGSLALNPIRNLQRCGMAYSTISDQFQDGRHAFLYKLWQGGRPAADLCAQHLPLLKAPCCHMLKPIISSHLKSILQPGYSGYDSKWQTTGCGRVHYRSHICLECQLLSQDLRKEASCCWHPDATR